MRNIFLVYMPPQNPEVYEAMENVDDFSRASSTGLSVDHFKGKSELLA